MDFNYFYQEVATQSLDVDDIGNVAIRAQDETHIEYYLIISTEFGLTKVFEYGPSIPDVYELPLHVSASYNQFEFNETKIIKRIDKFLNSNTIAKAEVVEKEEIIPLIRRLENYV